MGVVNAPHLSLALRKDQVQTSSSLSLSLLPLSVSPPQLTLYIHQGFGRVNLAKALHFADDATTKPFFFVDRAADLELCITMQSPQSPAAAAALAASPATEEAMKITLVWTDPPGNPIAASQLGSTG